jgi:hypothetical protein
VANGNDIFLAKYDANGVHQWSKRFGGSSSDTGYGVAADGSDAVIVAGTFLGTADFGGGDLVSVGSSDIFVAKYDASGVHQWSKGFGSTTADGGFAVAANTSGSVVITGYFTGTADFQGGPLVNAGGNDVFVARYDASGAHQWSQRFGSTSNDIGFGVALDSYGNTVVTGHFTGTVDFGGGNLVSSGPNDVFLAKYSANGLHQWSSGFGGSSGDAGYGVAINASEDVGITGDFQSTANFGGSNLVSAGGYDVYIAEFLCENPIPVLIQRFDAVAREGAVELSWDVWSDEAIENFRLERGDVGTSRVNVVAQGAFDTHLRSYRDASVEPGRTYDYALVLSTGDGNDIRSAPARVTTWSLATVLGQNYPNPFNPKTTIDVTLSERSPLVVGIYDAAGTRVAELNEGIRDAGTHRIEWNGTDATGRSVGSGVYFYRLEGAGRRISMKMILLK